jgi:glycosyltransferase involved in cell wall biosynthesis
MSNPEQGPLAERSASLRSRLRIGVSEPRVSSDPKEARAGAASHRILLVAPAAPPYGGMALQAGQLGRMLRRDGNSVAFSPSNFPFPRGLRFFGRIPGVRTLARAFLIWFKLWNAARQADVVHVLAASWVYFFVVVYPTVLVGKACRKRVVVNYRGGEAKRFFRRFGWLAGPVFRLADAITAPSEFLAEVIRARFQVPVAIVPNLLDSSFFRYRQRTAIRPRILVTRHLEKIYDIESVLRAFRAVQQEYSEASLWIVGTGSQEAYLRGLAAEWNLANVRFWGHVAHRDLPAIYDQCDVYLNASQVDNFPGALLEASASGLIVVSSAAGGIPFIYRDGESALLVEPGNWEGLAQSVRKVLNNSVLAMDMTKAAVALVRACEWHEVRKSLYQAYGFPLETFSSDETTGGGLRCAAG